MSTIPPWFRLPEHTKLAPKSADLACPIVIVGCGLAGCHIAFELATRGKEVVLVDGSDTVAGGASGNSAGIVKPFITRSPGRADQFYKAAFNFLMERFDADKRLHEAAQFNQCGVLQLFEREYPYNNAYTTCSAHAASVFAGVRVTSPAVYFERGGWLNPAALCQALTDHQNIEVRLQHSVRSIIKKRGNWLVACGKGAGVNAENSAVERIECATLILANGPNANKFSPTAELPIIAARGQTSRFTTTGTAVLKTVVTGKRYAIPDGNDVVVGASFIRNETDTQLLTSEHAQNLDGLHTLLPALNFDRNAHSGFCAIRATTPDRLPVVGPMPIISNYSHDYARLSDGLPEHHYPNANYERGLYIFGGFGSRGIVSTPYCAKLLADYLCGSAGQDETKTDEHTDCLSSWSALLHPGRFKVRDLKRTRGLK